MKEIVQFIKAIAQTETERILQEKGKFHSAHEAFAVALEEWQEAKEELEQCEIVLNQIWEGVRVDDYRSQMNKYKVLYNRALYAAAECAQLAAVCQKALTK